MDLHTENGSQPRMDIYSNTDIRVAMLSKFNESHPLTPVVKVNNEARGALVYAADKTDLRLRRVSNTWRA
jgi:hypothetical protein